MATVNNVVTPVVVNHSDDAEKLQETAVDIANAYEV